MGPGRHGVCICRPAKRERRMANAGSAQEDWQGARPCGYQSGHLAAALGVRCPPSWTLAQLWLPWKPWFLCGRVAAGAFQAATPAPHQAMRRVRGTCARRVLIGAGRFSEGRKRAGEGCGNRGHASGGRRPQILLLRLVVGEARHIAREGRVQTQRLTAPPAAGGQSGMPGSGDRCRSFPGVGGRWPDPAIAVTGPTASVPHAAGRGSPPHVCICRSPESSAATGRAGPSPRPPELVTFLTSPAPWVMRSR